MSKKTCPVWLGYVLLFPLRKLFQSPRRILSPYVREGMTVMDIGCAMGYFSLPLAEMVGPAGKVISVDLQKDMIVALEKRADRAGLSERIETRQCGHNTLGLDDLSEQVDFALAFAVVHEVHDPERLFSELCKALKPGARLLIAEPRFAVKESELQASIAAAEKNGFASVGRPKIGQSRTILLEKKQGVS